MDIYKTICRVCLCPDDSKNLISLLDKTNNDGLSCFGKAAQLFANIHISLDFLPSSMCIKCLRLLQQAILFKKTCEKSQEKLEKLLVTTHYLEDEFRNKLIESVMTDTVGQKNSLSNKPIASFECLNDSQTCGKPQNLDQTQGFFKDKTLLQAQNARNINIKVKIEPIITSENEISTYTSELENNFFDEDYFEDIFENPDKHVDEYLDMLEDYVLKEEQTKKFKIKDLPMYLEGQTSGVKREKQEKDMESEKNPDEILDSIEVLIKLEQKHHPGSFGKQIVQPKTTFKMLEPNKIYKINDTIAQKTVKEAKTLLRKTVWRKPSRLKPKKKVKEDCICHYCNRKYANKGSLVAHIRRHTGAYTFICEHCALPFPTKGELQYHLNATHNIGKKLICDYCGFRTPKKTPLIEHIRTHTGEKPFTCDKCGIQFKHRAAWRKHRIYHTEKSVQCTLCPKKFFTKASLAEHSNSVHERKYMYVCDCCGVTYAKTKNLHHHLEQKHGIERAQQGRLKRTFLDGSAKHDPARLNRRRLLQPGVVVGFRN